jgi:hypothetical protein
MSRPTTFQTDLNRRVRSKILSWRAFIGLFLFQSFLAISADGAATRLAVGTLGLMPAVRDGEIADLVTAQLSATQGFDLVERRELDRVLREAGLALSGVVRAKDAMRVGALIRADQFLLGTSASINGTNLVFFRLVDARTGVINGIEIIQDDKSSPALAAKIANFVRGAHDHPMATRHDYLAIGVVQNLGVNDRFPDFPTQMRASVAAQLSKTITVLERDVISFLANEVRLDLAGLTEQKPGQTPHIQFGFWIVDGFYQSYEVKEPEVQIKLRVERVGGGQQSFVLQGLPAEELFHKIDVTIEQAVGNPSAYISGTAPSRRGEIEALEARAAQLVDYRSSRKYTMYPLTFRIATNPDKIKSALEEATRVFESILLLDPNNNAARIRLAGCLVFDPVPFGGSPRDQEQIRRARAQDLYQEVIASGDQETADDARVSLAECIGGLSEVELLRRFAAEAADPETKMLMRQRYQFRLEQQEHRLPISETMPIIRQHLLDELTEVQKGHRDLPLVTYDDVLASWRLDAVKRSKIVNTLLPEIIEKFPDLKPYILLAAAGEQCDTNSPVITQFFDSLKYCEAQPESVRMPTCYFAHLSSTLEDENEVRQRGGLTLLQRTFERNQFATVIVMATARQRAAQKGLAPPLTTIGKTRLAQSYMALQQWKEALGVLNEVPDDTRQAKNECRRHLSLPLESEELPNSAWERKGDREKVEIAYQCIERKQWSTAISILGTIQHRVVHMNHRGPWGFAFVAVAPAAIADECRARAGLPAVKDPMRFELGNVPYVSFLGARMYSFALEREDVWLGTYSQIKRFRGEGPFAADQPVELHEFNRSTDGGNTCVCLTADYVWAGTANDGLLELNRKTGACRRLTMNDGLLMNGISGLKLQGNTLWITYGNVDSGGIGMLDLATHKFSALTPTLSPGAGTNSQTRYDQGLLEDPHQPPQLPISAMTSGAAGEMWFAIWRHGIRRFRGSGGGWDAPLELGKWEPEFTDFAAEPALGMVMFSSRNGGYIVYDYVHNQTSWAHDYRVAVPCDDVSAVALDGRIAWVGGNGFVAVVDIVEKRMLRVAYISASKVASIRLDRTHAWVALSCGKEFDDPNYAGNERTGIYRLNRASIEPAKLAANQK